MNIPSRDRHFLFLQGLVGPGFRLLSDELKRRGHRITRVNFNGGDLWDWRGKKAINYSGKDLDFPTFLEALIARHGITDMVLFGDCRPLHAMAIKYARAANIKTHIFEEGTLRPNFVSLDHVGSNAASDFPRDMAAIRELSKGREHSAVIPIEGSFRRRLRETTCYHLALAMLHLFFRRRHYRPNAPRHETLAWIKRYFKKTRETRMSTEAIKQLSAKQYFLLPMQIDGDFQIRNHSDFSGMEEAIRFIMDDFAQNAPQDSNLLIKMHPFDPNMHDWRKIVESYAAGVSLSDKVHFIERGDLDPILAQCAGVVTINSTVGPLALAVGKPVLPLGRAIYDIDGLTAQCSLAEFWNNPPDVNADNYRAFVDALRNHNLVNGGFHSEQGLKLLIERAADCMTAAASR